MSRGARVMILLALLPGLPSAFLAGQEAERDFQSVGQPGFSLQPAFPNPFDEETRIPFILGDELFRGGGGVEVSMRVYNLLHQLVAIPTLREENGSRGRPVDEILMGRPGSYEAIWDGTDRGGARVTPGPYFVQLAVEGRTQVRKLLLVR